MTRCLPSNDHIDKLQLFSKNVTAHCELQTFGLAGGGLSKSAEWDWMGMNLQ